MGKEIMILTLIVALLFYFIFRIARVFVKLNIERKKNKELNEWGKSDECRK